MRRIIEGVAYDTETSTLVARGDHDHELSQAWWSLYRTLHGAFFEVVADHDGVVEQFDPLTDRQARAFLEVNANHLVEKYFGPMPEAYPMRFSRRAVIAAIEVLDQHMSQAQLTRYLLKLGPDFLRWVGDEKISVSKRLNNLIGIVDQRPDRQLDSGELLRDVLVEEAVSRILPPEPKAAWLSESGPAPSYVQAFQRALAIDGFTVSDGVLRRALPIDIGLPAVQSEVDRLLEKHGFTTAKGHLKQALEAHTRGSWAAANSQIRTFLDALLDDVAVKLDPAALAVSSGQQRRIKLAEQGFLSRELNEWDGNGLGFINGLAKRLHPKGSHPGLSDDDDSTFRLHVELLTARLLLARFDTWGWA
jgi:hypothetical protein